MAKELQGACRTFVTPQPATCDAPALRAELSETDLPFGASRPALAAADDELRVLLTPGSTTFCARPPAVPELDGDAGGDELFVVFLQDTEPAHWRQALAWCDAFVLVMEVSTPGFDRYYRFLKALDPSERARTRFHWAPAAALPTHRARSAIDAAWCRIAAKHLQMDASVLHPAARFEASTKPARAGFVRWIRFQMHAAQQP